ncbi:MAG: hypothetical protein LUG60_04115 [Erysipelotrichaceae bacterium]|nr:hypothetical protein [Erysipelotrichaceae bacterium]
MRCDVCGYKIMPGVHECPNCGYKWDDGHVNTFDRSAYDHGHIQNKPKSQVKPQRKTVINPKSSFEKGNIIQLIVKVVVGLWIIGLLCGLVVGLVSNASYVIGDIFETLFEDDVTYTGSAIVEAINEGYEYDGILQRKEATIAFFEDLGLEDIDDYDYVGSESYVSFTVYAYDDDYTMYQIGETYVDGALYETSFVTSGYLESSIQSGDLTINKDMIDTIDDYIECGNLYDMINVYRKQLVEEDDDYEYYDGNIYFTEEYEDYSDDYYYYFSIDF